MKLLVKFNIAFIIVLLIGVPLSIYQTNKLLLNQATQESLERAKLVLEIANSVRTYTAQHVRPEIHKLTVGEEDAGNSFRGITVPAFAAQRVFSEFKDVLPEYSYKEASRNPTNLANRAVEWEDDIIEYFMTNPTADFFEGQRQTQDIQQLYIAKPMWIKNPGCLVCHSDPEIAPAQMKDRYGLNGFGFKQGDLIATQLVTIPLEYSIKRSEDILKTMTISIFGIALGLWLLLNFMLYSIIIKPIQNISKQVNQISTGRQDLSEITVKGNDEISELTRAFNRMQRSMMSSLRIIQGETRRGQ